MLKQTASSVLASFRPYPKRYASARHSLRPCWLPVWTPC